MSVTRQKLRIDPAKFYVAWQSAVTEIDGADRSVREGERLRGDDELVKRLGAAAFVEDGTPRADWPSPYTRSIADAEAEAAKAPPPAPPKIDPTTPASELWYCHTRVVSSAFGAIWEGTVVRTGDPRLATGVFQPLIERVAR